MKKKLKHKNSSGAAAKLIREEPRQFTGDLSDKKALAAYQIGEVAFDSKAVVKTELDESLTQINDRMNKRRELVRGMDEKFQAEMPVEDKVKRAVVNSFKKVMGFIRRKI